MDDLKLLIVAVLLSVMFMLALGVVIKDIDESIDRADQAHYCSQLQSAGITPDIPCPEED